MAWLNPLNLVSWVLDRFHEEPNPGDLIEISRTGYHHWALYVGNGYVIHLTSPDENHGIASVGTLSVNGHITGMVKRERLADVVGSCKYKVNNHLDRKYKPRPVHEILRSANAVVGKTIDYSILNRNCEHLVTYLRYGKAHSLQAENFMMKTVAVSLGVRLLLDMLP